MAALDFSFWLWMTFSWYKRIKNAIPGDIGCNFFAFCSTWQNQMTICPDLACEGTTIEDLDILAHQNHPLRHLESCPKKGPGCLELYLLKNNVYRQFAISVRSRSACPSWNFRYTHMAKCKATTRWWPLTKPGTMNARIKFVTIEVTEAKRVSQRHSGGHYKQILWNDSGCGLISYVCKLLCCYQCTFGTSFL